MQKLLILEKERKIIEKKLKGCKLFIIAVSFLIFIFFLRISENNVVISFFTTFTFYLFLYFICYAKITKKFKKDFKNQVMPNLIKEIDENLFYKPESYITFDEFNSPKLYDYPQDYTGNDFIYGNIDGIDIKFSDIYATRKIENDGKTDIETIFKGIFFLAEFNKNFTSKTYVISNLMHCCSFDIGDRAYMDNAEFQKEFKTYTNDQINARYILSPNLMEKILKIKELFKVPINLCFMDNKIYIYIEFNSDQFEANPFVSLIGSNSIVEKYKKEMLNLINLVKYLNLDSKIWKV